MTTYLSVLFLVTYIHFNVININLQSDIHCQRTAAPFLLKEWGRNSILLKFSLKKDYEFKFRI